MDRSHRNPFGIPEDDMHFDELLAMDAASSVGEVHLTKALAWLEQWQKDNPLFWAAIVKTHDDGVSMTSGCIVVSANDKESAEKKMREIASTWDDNSYIPPFAEIKGPFNTEAEAKA